MGVCGLGYVGLPLAVDKAKHGFHTIGFDVQQEKVDMVNAGKNYIGDVVNSDLEELVSSGMLSATTDFSRVCDVDFIAICVPTPLDKHQQPDISYVRDSTIAIAKHLTRGSIVVLESTTYPGTTEELLKPLLEEGSGLKCGTDFYLGFSPERIDPGNLIYKTSNTPKVVGAIGADAVEVIAMVYRSILEGDVTTVSSPAVAEMEKILENTYRNINIGLVNELAILCNKMNIDIWEVIDAAKTKPYGFQAFYPGPQESVNILLEYKDGMKKVSSDEIVYAEIRDHWLHIFSVDEEYQLLSTLKEFAAKLADYHFICCSSSFCINMKYVTDFQKDIITLNDKTELKVSRSKKKEVKQALLDYYKGGLR